MIRAPAWPSWAERLLLAISSLVAVAIGVALSVDPARFRAGYGVVTPDDAGALSELRAPGGALVALGLVMALGAIRSAHRRSGLLAASATFLGYGAARLVGLAIDGPPPSDLVTAAVVELVFGALALSAWTGSAVTSVTPRT